MPQKIKPNQTDNNNSNLVLICVGFGLSLLVEAYVFGVLLGGWLDIRFNSKPWFTVVGIMLALFGSFYQLYRMLNWRPARRNKPPAEQPPKEN